uniref:Uncharacterized protein K0116D04.17 n=1 Tax=Oryza sativa subsp. indica TaxID=39946 RepID=C8TFB8_ORYSI|nr:hypothetical protein [Oryza sativa Indica Group]
MATATPAISGEGSGLGELQGSESAAVAVALAEVAGSGDGQTRWRWGGLTGKVPAADWMGKERGNVVELTSALILIATMPSAQASKIGRLSQANDAQGFSCQGHFGSQSRHFTRRKRSHTRSGGRIEPKALEAAGGAGWDGMDGCPTDCECRSFTGNVTTSYLPFSVVLPASASTARERGEKGSTKLGLLGGMSVVLSRR